MWKLLSFLRDTLVFEILTQSLTHSSLVKKKKIIIIPNHIGKLSGLSNISEQFIINHQHFISREDSESCPKYHWTTPRLSQILNEIFSGSFEILLLMFNAFVVSLSPDSFSDSWNSTLIIAFIISEHSGNEDSLCTRFIKCILL